MKKLNFIFIILFLMFLGSGCSKATPTEIPTQVPVQNTIEPTATTAPLALQVNGEGILQSEYDAQIARLQMALSETGTEMTPEQQKERIISNLIDEVLLSQAATAAGFSISDAELSQRIDTLISGIGGQEKFNEWLSTYSYTEESFRNELRRSLLAAWQRDQIIESVPQTADQVHAYQLLYQDIDNAVAALNQIKAGTDFSTLAKAQDPTLGGDLGWFPQGTLTQPEVEAVAFALEPGEISDVIQSGIGYHIIKVVERDAEHPLSTEARRKLQELKLDEWLKTSRDASTIEIFVP
ncbi:MAG: peptidylprolyl isomerase [Anaerolineaceae bacterium]|nr:peptidylprolyl isomerase [Anaerolineaceae bacterium]